MTSSRSLSDSDCEREAGFTLIELLVALALFSLLATLLFGNVRFGLAAWQHSSKHTVRSEQIMMAQSLIRQLILDAYPLFLGYEIGAGRIDFEGAKDGIKLLGNAPVVAGGGGRFRFDLHVERHQDQSDLVMTSAPELANSRSQLLMSTKTRLLADVDRVDISYFGADATGRTAQWHEKWTHRNELPKLVRVRVAFRPGDERMWPDLLIAPRVSADVGCTYDPVTTRCKGR